NQTRWVRADQRGSLIKNGPLTQTPGPRACCSAIPSTHTHTHTQPHTHTHTQTRTHTSTHTDTHRHTHTHTHTHTLSIDSYLPDLIMRCVIRFPLCLTHPLFFVCVCVRVCVRSSCVRSEE